MSRESRINLSTAQRDGRRTSSVSANNTSGFMRTAICQDSMNGHYHKTNNGPNGATRTGLPKR